jgi:hypothetical protein
MLRPVKLCALKAHATQVKPVVGGGRSVQLKGFAAVCLALAALPYFHGPAASFGEVDVDAAVAGARAWVAAGEKLSGWDMSCVPIVQRASRASLKFGCGSAWDANPLMALYCHLAAHSPLTSKSGVAMIEQRFDWRTCICSYFSWAVPNLDALQALLALGPLVELGAGTGYWAWLLTRMGADIIAYDVAQSHEGQGYRFRHQLVRDGGVHALKSSGNRALLLCWPDIVGDDADSDSDRGHFASTVTFVSRASHVAYCHPFLLSSISRFFPSRSAPSLLWRRFGLHRRTRPPCCQGKARRQEHFPPWRQQRFRRVSDISRVEL